MRCSCSSGRSAITVIGPQPQATLAPTGQAAERTWAQVAAALEGASFQVQDPVTPYRPGESRALQDVPRRLLQVILPSEPQGGYVVDLRAAHERRRGAGRARSSPRTSRPGPGAIQYPRDSQFVLRRVGPTLVFYPWSAEANPDPRVPELAAALETLGVPITP